MIDRPASIKRGVRLGATNEAEFSEFSDVLKAARAMQLLGNFMISDFSDFSDPKSSLRLMWAKPKPDHDNAPEGADCDCSRVAGWTASPTRGLRDGLGVIVRSPPPPSLVHQSPA